MTMVRTLMSGFVLLVLSAQMMAADETPSPTDTGGSPRETAKKFFDLALAGKHKEAAALGQKGQAPSRETKVKEIGEVLVGQKVELLDLFADDESALVITSTVTGDKGEKGPLAVTLRKIDGRWTVRDIDLESDDSIKGEIQRFKERYPNAKHSPPPKGKSKTDQKQ